MASLVEFVSELRNGARVTRAAWSDSWVAFQPPIDLDPAGYKALPPFAHFVRAFETRDAARAFVSSQHAATTRAVDRAQYGDLDAVPLPWIIPLPFVPADLHAEDWVLL